MTDKKPAAGRWAYTGDPAVVHLPSGPVTVTGGDEIDLDGIDAAAVAANPEWAAVTEPSKPKSAKATEKQEGES